MKALGQDNFVSYIHSLLKSMINLRSFEMQQYIYEIGIEEIMDIKIFKSEKIESINCKIYTLGYWCVFLYDLICAM